MTLPRQSSSVRSPTTNTGETSVSYLLDDLGTIVGVMFETLTMIANGYCYRGSERHDLTAEDICRLANDARRIASGLPPGTYEPTTEDRPA